MKTIQLSIVAFLSILVFGCPNAIVSTPTAKTAPTILSSNPNDSAMNIATNSSINAIFSTGMDATTINTGSFTINQAGTPVEGTVSYDNATKTATFKPSTLSGNEFYTVTITTAVKNSSGTPLATAKTWTFTTGTAPDITPPSVVSTVPVDLAANIAVEQPIAAIFSEAIEPATITISSFTISGGVTGSVSYNATTRTAFFTPTGRLAASSTYTATIESTITDTAGNPMAASKVWIFTTTDKTAPIVNVIVDQDHIPAMVPTGTYQQAQPPAIIPGKGGNGADFEGDDQFLMIPDTQENRLTGAGGSIECWIYPTVNAGFQGIIHKGVMSDFSDESYSLQYWYVSNGNAQLAIILDKAPGDYLAVVSDYIIAPDTWYHIVAAWSTTTTSLYVNGALVASQASNGYVPIQNSVGGVVIGKQIPDSSSGYYTQLGYKGVISDIQLYDRAMGAQEVVDHYNATNH
jgi:hypothetical protein